MFLRRIFLNCRVFSSRCLHRSVLDLSKRSILLLLIFDDKQLLTRCSILIHMIIAALGPLQELSLSRARLEQARIDVIPSLLLLLVDFERGGIARGGVMRQCGGLSELLLHDHAIFAAIAATVKRVQDALHALQLLQLQVL